VALRQVQVLEQAATANTAPSGGRETMGERSKGGTGGSSASPQGPSRADSQHILESLLGEKAGSKAAPPRSASSTPPDGASLPAPPPPHASSFRRGAAGDAQLAALHAEVVDLREAVADHETRETLLMEQSDFLKSELRELQRNQARGSMDTLYLKNVVIKYMETHDLAGLLPVLAETLHLSQEEVERIRQYRGVGKGVFGRLLQR